MPFLTYETYHNLYTGSLLSPLNRLLSPIKLYLLPFISHLYRSFISIQSITNPPKSVIFVKYSVNKKSIIYQHHLSFTTCILPSLSVCCMSPVICYQFSKEKLVLKLFDNLLTYLITYCLKRSVERPSPLKINTKGLMIIPNIYFMYHL